MAEVPDQLIKPEITLVVCRCYECGHFYGVEKRRTARCPYCAAEDVRRAVNARETAERSAAATRGALARLKKLLDAYKADFRARTTRRPRP